jgi:hypothetical protein
VLAEVSEEVVLPSSAVEMPAEVESSLSAVEVATEVAPLEAPVGTLAIVVPEAGATLVRENPPVVEEGSGSFPNGDGMGELARQMVQQFFTSMRSCIDLIFRGSSSFSFARTLLRNMAGNVELTGGPILAQACLRVVDQLGDHLRELESLAGTSSVSEVQATFTRLLAAQEQERKEAEARIDAEVRSLEYSRAECQKLADDSRESELVMQSTEHVITSARDTIAKARDTIAKAQETIAKAEAVLVINEEKLVTIKEELAGQQAAKARAEESLSLHSSRVESLQAQLAAKPFLSEEELRARATMEAEKARQHEMHRLREQIHSLANQGV